MILPLTPVNQRKDVQGCAALTPHLIPDRHIFTCSLCEHLWCAGNAAGLKPSDNVSWAQTVGPFSTGLSSWLPGHFSGSDSAHRPCCRDFSSGLDLNCPLIQLMF